MPFTPKFVDLVKNSTTVQGTGAVSLGAAVSGFTGFASACVAGDQFYYCIQGIDKPAEREVGRGTFQADGTISRDAALGGPLKNFSSGNKTVALVAAAEWYAKLETMANAPAPSGSSGAAPSPLFTAAAGSVVATPVVAVTSAGYSANGIGEARYVQDAAVDAAFVTANPKTSFRCADGRGFRLCSEQRLTVEMFGAIPGDSSAGAKAANDAAFKAACQFRIGGGTSYGAEIHVGPNIYYLGQTLEPEGPFRLIGQAGGHVSGAVSGTAQTRMIAPTNTTVLRIRATGTDGAGLSAGKVGAYDSVIKGISFEQATMGTTATAHGIHMRGLARIEECSFVNIAGNGIEIYTDSGYTVPAIAGAADEWRIINSYIHSCGGHGLHIDGNESNAGYSQGVVFHQCGGCAIVDGSNLANAHYSPQITGYGNGGVSFGGHLYQLITRNTALSATTTPGTNNSVWYDLGTYPANANFPAWASGTTYIPKLPYLIENGSPIFGGYTEFGTTIGHSNGLIIGGTMNGTSYTNVVRADVGGLSNNRGVARLRSTGGNSADPAYPHIASGELVGIGQLDSGNGESGRSSLLTYVTDVFGGSGDRFSFDWLGDKEIRWSFGNRIMAFMGGRNTDLDYGRTTAQPGIMTLAGYAIAPSLNGTNDGYATYARIHHGAINGVPSAGYHAAGEFTWNLNNPGSGILGWSCTASGTPGTWTPVPVAGFTGSYNGTATFTGELDVKGVLFASDTSTGYGLRVSPGDETYVDNQKPFVGFGSKIWWRSQIHVFQAGTAGSVTDRLIINGSGAAVTGTMTVSGTVTGSNLSGTNSGDQTITLTGDVTGGGTGSFPATIGANKVSFAKMVAATQAAFLGATAAGNFGELTPTVATAQLNVLVGANGTVAGTKGLVPAPAATDNLKLLRGDGAWVAASAGTVTSASVVTANGVSGTVANATTTPAITLTLGAITPGSVAATGAITSSGGGVGYATGAGGAVSQATSRTTGVTLNKLAGAITLFSATTTAGQTTTLTVTNSQVAATDTVVVNQASGAGLYTCAVTKVVAGSFNLSVYTPAAVATAEAPLLNFAVLKAVAA